MENNSRKKMLNKSDTTGVDCPWEVILKWMKLLLVLETPTYILEQALRLDILARQD
jgi:hypothetical protein